MAIEEKEEQVYCLGKDCPDKNCRCCRACGQIGSLMDPTDRFRQSVETGYYTSTVMRALGIAIIAQMTSEICRDCGENSTASGVELAGKIEIFILCLPLISEIIGYAGEILAMC